MSYKCQFCGEPYSGGDGESFDWACGTHMRFIEDETGCHDDWLRSNECGLRQQLAAVTAERDRLRTECNQIIEGYHAHWSLRGGHRCDVSDAISNALKAALKPKS